MIVNAPLLDHLQRQSRRTIDVIDSHTCGQPTRVVVAGTGIAPGTAPGAARDLLLGERDWIRRLAVMEPRGHRSMFGVALIPPDRPDMPFGLVYMDANGYPEMCGHATIGAATTLFEAGYLLPETAAFTGETSLQLRAPMGDLLLRVRFEAGRPAAVAFRTPLAFYLGSLVLDLGAGRRCPVDVAYGGQWYAYAPVERCGLTIDPAHIDGLVAAAAAVRRALADQLALVDPLTGIVPTIGNIVWTSHADRADADARNVPVSSAGAFDRSPCGTATCARMAVLAAQGSLRPGEAFVNQGLVGTLYRGRIVGAVAHGSVEGIVPEVEGSAWLTGAARLWADERDPLGDGFLT